ncbi:MAG: laminin G domain-containing protein, partial [Planctomycetales bacterium]|nr:laminin G domain-containing protein [Planctomycetales bacterium]
MQLVKSLSLKQSRRRRFRLNTEQLEDRVVLAADPIAYWSFDSAANLGADDSGNAANLNVFGNATQDAGGIRGGALALDGNGDYLGGNAPASLPLGRNDYTIAAWIKPDTMGKRAIVSWGSYPNTFQYNTFGVSNTNSVRNDWASLAPLNITATDAVVSGAGIDLDDGQWHHVAVTYDSVVGTRTLYVDGQPLVSAGAALNSATGINFRLGSVDPSPTGEYFDGLLDDVAIWDTPLEANQIAALVGGSSPLELTESGLAAHWIADDLAGTVADGGSVSSWSDGLSGIDATASGTVTLETGELNGHAVVRFNPGDGGDNLRVLGADNPLSGIADFTAVVVFRANATGVGGSTNWFANTGLIDAEQSGVTNDWGLSLNSDGQVGAGLGNPDVTKYSTTGADFADGGAHVAIYTREAGQIRLYVDNFVVETRTDGGAALRNTSDLTFGSLQSNLNFFDGDIDEVQLYNEAIASDEANTLSADLMAKYDVQPPSVPLQIAGELLVDLKATHPSAGTESWLNTGTLGDFTRVGNPFVTEIDGVTAVAFNSDHPASLFDDAYRGPLAPVNITGNSTRSIEFWAYNPNDGLQRPEETIVAWGQRGGPDGTNMSFGYGNHATWGALGQWGAGPDMPWYAGGGSPTLGQWHHMVYTFDGSTGRVYSDGILTYSESFGALNTYANTNINIAAQNAAGGSLALSGYDAPGSFYVANIRIHSEPLSGAQVVANYAAGIQFAGDQPITGPDSYNVNEDGVLNVAAPG